MAELYQVEKILNELSKRPEYFIKRQGCADDENSRVLKRNLDCPDLLDVGPPKTKRQMHGSKKDEEHSDSEFLEKGTVLPDLEQEQTNGHDTVEETEQVDDNQLDEDEEAAVSTDPKPIFKNMYFILTSANRSTGPSPFTKKDVKKSIENREGSVIENFDNIIDDDKVYLIADTYYRTHKYLTALSLSIPTVSYKWIQESVSANKLLDYEKFMLDAGESSVDSKLHPWQPVKGKIFPGKRIGIFSIKNTNDPRVVNFREIWAPMVKNVGGIPVVDIPSSVEEIKEWFDFNEAVEYFIADEGTPAEIISLVKNSNGIPVTSEWLIQCIVTGEIVPENVMERYLFKTD